MTLDMPTPESLEAEANELDRLATKKEKQAEFSPLTTSATYLLMDAAIFRDEAASKRAKAERMRRAK